MTQTHIGLVIALILGAVLGGSFLAEERTYGIGGAVALLVGTVVLILAMMMVTDRELVAMVTKQ